MRARLLRPSLALAAALAAPPTLTIRAARAQPAAAGIVTTAPADAPPADAPSPAEDGPALSAYEQQALQHAHRALGLEPDPAPTGKRVGRVHVVNLDVFARGDGFLQAFNALHNTTGEDIIRREVLLQPGQTWDPDLVEETERKLRDPIFTTLVVMAPVKSPQPGHVDLLVVTRDVWSLRLNSSFEFQESVLTDLNISLSENNFLGWRKTAAFQFLMDQGSYSVGPLYLDKNVAGQRLQMLAQAALIFARDTSELEGSRSRLVFTRPLWTLASEWGATAAFTHADFVTRRFQGTALRAIDLAATPDNDMLPETFRRRFAQLDAGVVRQSGGAVKHQVEAGYRFQLDESEVLPDFAGDDVQRAAFEQEVLPRSERISSVFVGYRLFTPRFAKVRNVDGYALPEDLQLGPDVQLEAAPALSAIGSDQDFVGLSASASHTEAWGDGFVRVSASAGSRALLSGGGDRFVDRDLSAAARVVSPVLYGARVIARVATTARYRDTDNAVFFLGGQNGLRAYPVNAFAGDFRVVGNVEVRTLPLRIWFSRAGLLAFFDAGDANDDASRLSLKSDVGVGVRALLPQLSTLVYRLDVAMPLTTAEIPGLGVVPAGPAGVRVTAGVGQVF